MWRKIQFFFLFPWKLALVCACMCMLNVASQSCLVTFTSMLHMDVVAAIQLDFLGVFVCQIKVSGAIKRCMPCP